MGMTERTTRAGSGWRLAETTEGGGIHVHTTDVPLSPAENLARNSVVNSSSDNVASS